MRLSCLIFAFLLGVLPGILRAGDAGYPPTQETRLSNLAVLKDYRTRRVSSESRESNHDWRELAPGAALTLAELEGPGEVTHIWMTVNSPDPLHFTNLVLRVYYNGNEFPSIESPYGDFFGLGMSKEYYFSNPVQAIGTMRGLNSFWPMPFEESVKITLTNEGPEHTRAVYYYVDWREFETLPKGLGYLHAQYRQAFPNVTGETYTILETEGGRGHYMGVHLSIHTQVSGWWGEGDDIFTIDGEEQPSLWGTGSEDYFSGAWCYGETFYNDYFGMPLREKIDHSDNNYWNVYRYHLENPVAFQESLKLEIEHGEWGFDHTRMEGNNNHYSSVAYWYMEKPVSLIGELPPAKERKSNYMAPAAPEGVIQSQLMKATPSKGIELETQGMGAWIKDGKGWQFGDQVYTRRPVNGGSVEFTFELDEETTGPAVLHMTVAKDYGKVRISLDGREIVPERNLYNPEVAPVTLPIGELKLAKGEHTLKVEITGKDEKSENYMFGLDYLRVGGEPTKHEKAANAEQ